jgi:hypothetical protein
MTIMTMDARWMRAAAAAVVFAVLAPNPPLRAQDLDNGTVDAIVGSDVREEQGKAATDAGKIIAAIEKTADSIAAVRKTSSLDKVDIVFLADAAASEGGPPAEIENKVKQHEAEIAELRKEIEANALLFNAIDSRRVLPKDVLAVEFPDPRNVVIYAAAKPSE